MSLVYTSDVLSPSNFKTAYIIKTNGIITQVVVVYGYESTLLNWQKTKNIRTLCVFSFMSMIAILLLRSFSIYEMIDIDVFIEILVIDN